LFVPNLVLTLILDTPFLDLILVLGRVLPIMAVPVS